MSYSLLTINYKIIFYHLDQVRCFDQDHYLDQVCYLDQDYSLYSYHHRYPLLHDELFLRRFQYLELSVPDHNFFSNDILFETTTRSSESGTWMESFSSTNASVLVSLSLTGRRSTYTSSRSTGTSMDC